MMAVTEKEPVEAVPGENHGRSGEGARGLPVEEIWQLITAIGALEPPQSHRQLIGPVLTWLRKNLWRLLGVKSAHRQLVSLLSQIPGSRFVLRDGTLDRAIFLNIVAENEYRLPNSFATDDIVIDIGMHIGSFCFAALLRGCAHVYGFEAERENYNLAVRNLQRFGERVHLYHKAVWRSDRTGDALYSGNGYVQGNTGG